MSSGDVSKVSIDYGTSEGYTQEEIEQAANAVLQQFQNSFSDCRLEKLEFSGDEVSNQKAAQYKHDKGIVFYADFQTGNNSDLGLNRNDNYTGYRFFAINDGDGWTVDTAGFGYG